MQNNIDILVVFLNNKGFQVPGKLFYYKLYKKPVLIIENGMYVEEIKKEFQDCNHYFFSENNIIKINDTIKKILIKSNNY
jgi:hypothetical protein